MSQEKFMTWLKSGSDEMCMLKTPSSECAYFRHKLSNGLDIIYAYCRIRDGIMSPSRKNRQKKEAKNGMNRSIS